MTYIKKILSQINKNFIPSFLIVSLLWLLVWATYNAEIFRIFVPGFPHNILDLFHGIRTIFPFVAFFIAIYILLANKGLTRDTLQGPLTLLLLYSIVGSFASINSLSPVVSFYWGLLYMGTIVVLLSAFIFEKKEKIVSVIIRINWVIACIISLALVIIFFSQPGSFSLSAWHQFMDGARPFESLNNITKANDFFSMPGTRPTGLGRYAGIAAIFLFVNFLGRNKKEKVIYFLLFLIFIFILIFSRARTSVLSFILVSIFIMFIKSDKKINFIFILLSIFLLLWPTRVYNIFWEYFSPRGSEMVVPIGQISTLSGRTTEIWPAAIKLFSSSPVIGKGFFADRIFLNGLHAHNSIVQALVQSGLIGAIFFSLSLIFACIILAKMFLKDKKNILLAEIIGIFLFLCIRSITESYAYFGADFLFIAPIFAYIQLKNNQENNISVDKSMDILGSRVAMVSINDLLEKTKNWIKNEGEKLHWIVFTGMHGLVEAHRNKSFKYVLDSADLFVPDGISLVWVGKMRGFKINKRVSAADFMMEFFKLSEKEGFSNYFYGDTNETLQALNKKLLLDFPNLKIAGSYSPPFRALTPEEDAEIINKINQAKPDVLWVGLGLPKQERWIYKHREELSVSVVAGVGATFKFLSGKVQRAPGLVGDMGFEWLWRLFLEPKRIWKRVFFDIPLFFWILLKEWFENIFKI